MYFITEKQWREIPEGYRLEHSDKYGGKACFLGCITPGGGTTLVFEHLHFEIIPDDFLTGDEEKDKLTLKLLGELCDSEPITREEWRRQCMEALEGKTATKNFVNLMCELIANRLSLDK